MDLFSTSHAFIMSRTKIRRFGSYCRAPMLFHTLVITPSRALSCWTRTSNPFQGGWCGLFIHFRFTDICNWEFFDILFQGKQVICWIDILKKKKGVWSMILQQPLLCAFRPVEHVLNVHHWCRASDNILLLETTNGIPEILGKAF